MKTKIIILNIFCLFLFCHLVLADEVVLNNGEVIEGKIISLDKEGNIRIDVVLDNRLVGVVMEVKSEDVFDYKIDNKFEGLRRESPDIENKLANLVMLKNQKQQEPDIDEKIRQRVEKEKERIRDIEMRQEDKRRYEKDLAHEKEMKMLEAEIQIKILEASKKMGIEPNVNVNAGSENKCLHNRKTGICY